MVTSTFFFDIPMKKKTKTIKMVLKCMDIYFSVTPRLNPRIPDTAVVTTEVTAFDSDLCVTDIATKAKHGETKKLCVDITGYFNLKIY